MKVGKKKWIILIVILAVMVVGVVVDLSAGYLSRFRIGKEISDLFQTLLTEENQSMHLDLSANVNGESFQLDSDIYLVKEGETFYFVMEQKEVPIYIVDNLLFFENGHAFKLADEMERPEQDYKNLFLQIAAAYDAFDITCVKTDVQTNYLVKITGQQVQNLLELVMPMDGVLVDSNIPLERIESLSLEMIAQNEKVHEIKMTGSGIVNDVVIEIEIALSQFQILKTGVYEIPVAVKEAVTTVDESTLFSLTEDLYHLSVAFDKLTKQEPIQGSVALKANCGVLHLENTFNLSDIKSKEMESVDEEGLGNLPAAIGFLCMEGEIRSTETTQGHVYTLALDEDSMQKISEMVVPELVNYVIEFTEGKVEVLLEKESISSMKIEIGGSVRVLFTDVPVEVEIEFSFR